MSPSRALLWLSAFVVALAVALVVVTGGIGRIGPPTARPSATPSARPSPSPTTVILPVCTANQLQLLGAFNECASTVPSASTCTAAASDFAAVVRLHGSDRDFLLYLGVSTYSGPGTYDAGRSATVAIREYPTGALWQSTYLTLTVDSDGRSGHVAAGFFFQAGVPNPLPQLELSGPWSCA
jgi:hypothetical protein